MQKHVTCAHNTTKILLNNLVYNLFIIRKYIYIYLYTHINTNTYFTQRLLRMYTVLVYWPNNWLLSLTKH